MVDRVWVLLLGFLHFKMNGTPNFGSQGLKIVTWGSCLGVDKTLQCTGPYAVYNVIFTPTPTPRSNPKYLREDLAMSSYRPFGGLDLGVVFEKSDHLHENLVTLFESNPKS